MRIVMKQQANEQQTKKSHGASRDANNENNP